MSEPRSTVTVHVEYNTEDASPVYVASCDELTFTTDGNTFEEMLERVRECLVLNLQDTDSVTEFNVAQNPRIYYPNPD